MRSTTANLLAGYLKENGFNILEIPPKFTYTHQLFISMPYTLAEDFYKKCVEYGVSINLRNKRLYNPCGIRIGTQEISRYGWGKEEMFLIAEILKDIRDNEGIIPDILAKINTLSKQKKICYTFEKVYYDNVYNQLHNC